MKTKIFAIYDTAVKAFMQPHFTQSTGLALRQFTELANDKSTMVGKHPADFTLFELGAYDELSGTFENLSTPHSVATALSVQSTPILDPSSLQPSAEAKPHIARVRQAVERNSERNLSS